MYFLFCLTLVLGNMAAWQRAETAQKKNEKAATKTDCQAALPRRTKNHVINRKATTTTDEIANNYNYLLA